MSLLSNKLSRLVITFLSRSKHLLISWLQSPPRNDFGAQKNKVSHCYIVSIFQIIGSVFKHQVFYFLLSILMEIFLLSFS